MDSTKTPLICKRCKVYFTYSRDDCKWDERSSFGSTKYVTCPRCERIHILGYKYDAFDNLNDSRFYNY